MTALYMRVLRPSDRVAVKPHASPTFHAIQYLLGNQTREKLEAFRAQGGAQSYPSRTKDTDDVDISTGSVGLGVGVTVFASLIQDYLKARGAVREGSESGHQPGRMIAVVGDAELDEGNVFEALLEGWKHDVRNVWWILDYNRQSLDAVVTDRLFGRFTELFESMGWRVVTLKYGKQLEAAFAGKDGEILRRWIDDCPNELYSALVFKGGAAWRDHLMQDIGTHNGIAEILQSHDDDALAALMTNLGGHDMESVIEAFESVHDDRPTCFLAYTIKGFGLPFAGHKDNHAGLMSPAQMDQLRRRHQVREGAEWDPYDGLAIGAEKIQNYLDEVPFSFRARRRLRAAPVAVPPSLPTPKADRASTQEAFGRILAAIGRDHEELAERILTTSPDVAVSTNLGGWVNRKGVFSRHQQADVFKSEDVGSFQRWSASPQGQHLELGIAENNLFLALAAGGLAHSLFGHRLLPIGTVYDPFIARGLDALNYACYQDARFMLVATPSGVSLAPEGGAHQSIGTPLIGIAQDGLAYFEPAFTDELSTIMRWSFEFMQRDGNARIEDDWLGDAKGGAVYLRLSTRSIDQPDRTLDEADKADIVAGAYWIRSPAPDAKLVIVYTGVTASEALQAHSMLEPDLPGTGVLAVTSPDRLNRGWRRAQGARRSGSAHARSHIEELLSVLPAATRMITVVDGHPATLSWLGSVYGHCVHALGVDHFGQSGTVQELYRAHEIDAQAILDASAQACLEGGLLG